jgi:hypothetical protein
VLLLAASPEEGFAEGELDRRSLEQPGYRRQLLAEQVYRIISAEMPDALAMQS